MFELHHGDCRDVMDTLDANSVDTIVCDPPYGLEFMGKDWDHGVPGVGFWERALRVAKPGAMLLAFGGTRTHHRLMVAIEDAGWEIRDVVMWVYGSGFPKSHNISKAIDKRAGAAREVVGYDATKYRSTNGHNQTKYSDFTQEHYDNKAQITAPATNAARTWDGYGTALKPAWEPVVVAMKPVDGTFAENALAWGVAGLWIDGGRVPANGDITARPPGGGRPNGWRLVNRTERSECHPAGRWPANLIHDGSDEVVREFPESNGRVGMTGKTGHSNSVYGEYPHQSERTPGTPDSGSAARFFYTAKASRSERNAGLEGMEERAARRYGKKGQGPLPQQTPSVHAPETNHHPTVKPLALMRYLCRLTRTPTGGVVLDPFMGSGSTGCATVLEGRRFIGIEQDAEYIEIARRRIEHWAEQRDPQLELFDA